MPFLGIETSCDETGVAIIERSGKIVAEKLASQIALHEQYGGVVPELAAREHLRSLPILVDATLKEASLTLDMLEGIAVTRGPGLKGCLLMGYSFAKGISLSKKIPFIGVNHIEGHLLVPMLDNPELKFPYLALVVSGGHTEIVLVRGVGDYEIHARTLDDAAGEAFDKSAALLGLSYPGGPELAKLADTFVGENVATSTKLPRVMQGSSDFSFSGLKTAISLMIKANPETDKAELSFIIQNSIVATLIEKLRQVCKKTNINTVVVTGGVSANRHLRAEIKKQFPKSFFATREHSVDNAAMIAYVGMLRMQRGETTGFDSDVKARWWVEELQ